MNKYSLTVCFTGRKKKERLFIKLPRGKIKSILLDHMFYWKENKRFFIKLSRGKITSIFVDRMFYQKENKRFFIELPRGKK